LRQLKNEKKLESRLRAAFFMDVKMRWAIAVKLSWMAAVAMASGCASVAPPQQDAPRIQAPQAREHAPEPGATPWAHPHSSTWRHHALPGKRPSEFHYVRKDGRDAMAVTASSSASLLRKRVRVEPGELGSVRFSWMVPELIADADLALREADDSPVRIILAFEGDRSRFSPRDSLLSELARTLTGEEMPYATLMYVWCNKREPGTVVKSPRTDRIRSIVLESGSRRLNRWLDYERDIRADYERAFGEPPGALTAVAIMTDSDNTRARARAWYGTVRVLPAVASSR
jgi:hypothetical protein